MSDSETNELRNKLTDQTRSQHRELIGKFTIVCTVIESDIEDLLLGLLRLDRRHGAAVVKYINLNTQRELIRVLMADIYGSKSTLVADINKVLSMTEKVAKFRNDQIHGWHKYAENKVTTMVFKRGKLEPSVDEIDLSIIMDYISIGVDTIDLLRQISEAHNLPSPLPARKGHIASLTDALSGHFPGQTEQESDEPPSSSQD